MERRCMLRDVAPFITCALCRGYLVGATTAVECMHSFCRSCIVRHIASSNRCPVCQGKLHEARPVLGIRPDRTLQTLVYKLVPELYQRELRRLVAFYRERSLPIERQPFLHENYYHSARDRVSVCLLYDDSDASDAESRGVATRSGKRTRSRDGQEEDALRHFVLCPGAVTVAVLKKLLAAKYAAGDPGHVTISCDLRPLPDHLTLVDILYIHCCTHMSPLTLSFKMYRRLLAPEQPPAKRRRRLLMERGDALPLPPPSPSPLPSPSLPLGSPSLPAARRCGEPPEKPSDREPSPGTSGCSGASPAVATDTPAEQLRPPSSPASSAEHVADAGRPEERQPDPEDEREEEDVTPEGAPRAAEGSPRGDADPVPPSPRSSPPPKTPRDGPATSPEGKAKQHKLDDEQMRPVGKESLGNKCETPSPIHDVESPIHDVDKCDNVKPNKCVAFLGKLRTDKPNKSNDSIPPGSSHCADNSLTCKKNAKDGNAPENSLSEQDGNEKSPYSNHVLNIKRIVGISNVRSTKTNSFAAPVESSDNSRTKNILKSCSQISSSSVNNQLQNVLHTPPVKAKKTLNREDGTKVNATKVQPVVQSSVPKNKNLERVVATSAVSRHSVPGTIAVSSVNYSGCQSTAKKDNHKPLPASILSKPAHASTVPSSSRRPETNTAEMNNIHVNKNNKSIGGCRKCAEKKEPAKEKVIAGNQQDSDSPKALDLSLKCKKPGDVALPKPKLYLPYLLANPQGNEKLPYSLLQAEKKPIGNKFFHNLTAANLRALREHGVKFQKQVPQATPSTSVRPQDPSTSVRPPQEDITMMFPKPASSPNPYNNFYLQRNYACPSPTSTFVPGTNTGASTSSAATTAPCPIPRKVQRKRKAADVDGQQATTLCVPEANVRNVRDPGRGKTIPAVLKVPARKLSKREGSSDVPGKPSSSQGRAAEIPALLPSSHLSFLRKQAAGVTSLLRQNAAVPRPPMPALVRSPRPEGALARGSLFTSIAGSPPATIVRKYSATASSPGPAPAPAFLRQSASRWQDVLTGKYLDGMHSPPAGAPRANTTASKCGDGTEAKAPTKTETALPARTQELCAREAVEDRITNSPRQQTHADGNLEMKLKNIDVSVDKRNSNETHLDHEAQMSSQSTHAVQQNGSGPNVKKRSIENVAAVLTEKANKKTDTSAT